MVIGFPELVYEEKEGGEIDIGPNGTSLDLLRAVYRSPSQPLGTRLRAAGLAINFEHPRIQVVAQISGEGFAELLDRRLKHMEKMKEGKPKVIEHQLEVKPPLPKVPFDRRLRRI